MLRCGLALSLAAHAAFVFGLSMPHPSLTPDEPPADYEMIMAAEPNPVSETTSAVGPEPQPPAPSIQEPARETAPAEAPAQPPRVTSEPHPQQPAAPVIPEVPPASQPPAPPQPSPPKPRQAPAQPRPPTRVSRSPGQLNPRVEEAGPPAASEQSIAPALLQDAARPSPAWIAGVNAWLLAHRSYPDMARRLGRQGTAVIRLTVDRDGRVLEVSLVAGSGSEVLDQAAQGLVRDARLPPFPPDMALPRQTITVPIHYRLE